ncbi:Delta-aminolevulinic acid dehydratase [uncultured archaeon]|nr:Delta-aminolevulinic acid dehydratase [uncultured archaeon]
MEYICCIFVKEGIAKSENSPLPDVKYHSIESALDYITNLKKNHLNKFLIFGVPLKKDLKLASTSTSIVSKFAIHAKKKFGDSITLVADVGLSPYREDGHSVILDTNGHINETESYAAASALAVAFAKAGFDKVAPCLSLHDQVKHLRIALNRAGLSKTKILAYSSKFSSSLYGPYRQTIKSVLKSEDKKHYQTDYDNPKQALEQIRIDEEQGADIVMVKPGAFYLDILYQARGLTKLPLAVYHVSGEYAMIKAAAKNGLIDENEAFDEIHSGFNRCGTDYVIGYAPEHFTRWKKKFD